MRVCYIDAYTKIYALNETMIIAVAGTKGGSGKSTLATNLAVERARKKKRVMLIDVDEQGTSKVWGTVREESGRSPLISCVHLFGRGEFIPDDIEKMHEGYDDVIIDVGGRNTSELRAVFLVADKVCFPVKHSGADVWALDQTDEIFQEAKPHNPGVMGLVVVNLASTNPPKTEADDLKETFLEFGGFEYSGVVIRNRVAFERALNDGLGIIEYKPTDKKAQAEIRSFYNLVYDGKN